MELESRRGFLVMVGAAVLGRFALPELSGGTVPLQAPLDWCEHGLDPELARELVAVPLWMSVGRGYWIICAERVAGEPGHRALMMLLKTDEEIQEGKRLFDAAVKEFSQRPEHAEKVAAALENFREVFGGTGS